MRCADHPTRKAVAILPLYEGWFGVCSECWKKHRKAYKLINSAFPKKENEGVKDV